MSSRQRVLLYPYTLVHDMKANRTLMELEGRVVLPVGAEIELPNHDSVKVVRIRLLQPLPELEEHAAICLDVEPR